jgi:hypothetical protein
LLFPLQLSQVGSHTQNFNRMQGNPICKQVSAALRGAEGPAHVPLLAEARYIARLA